MQEPTDQQPHRHSPDAATLRDCRLCAIYRHPAQAAAGRKLTAHLAEHPFPKPTVTA